MNMQRYKAVKLLVVVNRWFCQRAIFCSYREKIAQSDYSVVPFEGDAAQFVRRRHLDRLIFGAFDLPNQLPTTTVARTV